MLSKKEKNNLLKVLMLKDKVKVNNFYNKNQFVIYTESATIFQSYKSIICILLDGVLYIDKYYINYSKTTSKHLYLFIRDYTRLNVYTLKELYEEIKNGTIKTY